MLICKAGLTPTEGADAAALLVPKPLGLVWSFWEAPNITGIRRTPRLSSSVRYLSALCMARVTDAFEPANITCNTPQTTIHWVKKLEAMKKAITENVWWTWKMKNKIILTGLVMSRSWTSSIMRLVDRRTGNLERVSLREICVICFSSFLFSQKYKATSTTIPAVYWFKILIILV